MTELKIDTNEFFKAVLWCVRHGFPGEIYSLYDGLQFCFPNAKKMEFDFICHSYSFGGSDGLLETMGLDEDDVVGYLTAEKLIELIEEKYNKE